MPPNMDELVAAFIDSIEANSRNCYIDDFFCDEKSDYLIVIDGMFNLRRAIEAILDVVEDYR
jgi:hypothetical protein